MESLLPESFAALDWILAAVLLFFALLKGSRGLYDSLMPLIITLVAIVGASILTLAMAAQLTESILPWVQKELLSRMDLSAIRSVEQPQILSQLTRLMPDYLTSLLRKLHLQIAPFVEEAMRGAARGATGAGIAEEAVSAMLRPMTLAVVRAMLFVLAFLLIKLMLTLVQKAAGLAFDLPVIRVVDRVGGFLLGFVECAVVLYLLFWLLDLLSPALFERMAESSGLLTAVFK